jgi:hypothetical protein
MSAKIKEGLAWNKCLKCGKNVERYGYLYCQTCLGLIDEQMAETCAMPEVDFDEENEPENDWDDAF